MKKFNFIARIMFLAFILSFAYSCQNEDQLITKETDQTIDGQIKTVDLQEFDYQALKEIETNLEKSGYDVSNVKVDESDPQLKASITDIFVKAVKVSCKTNHPDGSGRKIDLSGVVLIPKMSLITKLKTYRLLIAPPPTYTANAQAPSIILSKGFTLLDPANNPLSYLALQVLQGFIVIIPDYPGYGDSFNQCFHPYLKADDLVNSTIDFVKASQTALKNMGYKYKLEISVTGYSQGAFVASSLVRKLETNPSYNIKVNALVAGGTPCNLKQIADIVRSSQTTRHTYYLPYAFLGYQLNGYSNIPASLIFKEPYASKIRNVFNGYNTNPNDEFPTKVSDLYTDRFLKNLDTDPQLAIVNQLLIQNSLKPWINRCKFFMIHSIQDDSVYYINAEDYQKAHNKAGGNVTFYKILGTHTIAAAGYYPMASALLKSYDTSR